MMHAIFAKPNSRKLIRASRVCSCNLTWTSGLANTLVLHRRKKQSGTARGFKPITMTQRPIERTL
jgi:hypothetical protein